MNRRGMLSCAMGLVSIGSISKLYVSNKGGSLKLFVERKEILGNCMRGYLLTQLETESKPTVACYVLEKPPGSNVPYINSIPKGTYTVNVRIDGTLECVGK
jgi:hypothetical protein